MKNLHAQVDRSLLGALDVLLAERNVTRAAARLGISQSALSHKLRALREQFGDPLLVSGSGGLVLTERATAIAAPLRRALLDLDAAVEIGATFDPRTATRTFTISTADYGELVAIPGVIAAIEHAAPDIDLRVEPPGPDVAERLLDGRLDAAVGPPLAMPAAIMRIKLLTEGFRVALRSGHAALRGRWNIARYLGLRHLVIAPRGTRGSVVDDLLHRSGQTRRVALRVASFVAAPFIVASSDLCLTAPTQLLTVVAPRLGLVLRDAPFEIPLASSFLYWHARVDRDPGHQWLRGLILQSSRTGFAHRSVKV